MVNDTTVAPLADSFPLTGLLLNTMSDCLDREEREIHAVLERCRASNRNSICAYEERWFQYLLLRAARNLPECPSVLIEERFVDVIFVDNSGQELATFELKGPYQAIPATARGCRERIRGDFQKQLSAKTMNPAAEHATVLILTGTDAEQIRSWVKRFLLDAWIRERNSYNVGFSRPVSLNSAPNSQVLMLAAIAIE